ncbi:Fumarylacetoacetate (FAA) hydrolase-like protein 2 [Elsinoe fawcettii]|nr:Fumarylacetoacetate (FAA) hydrolase-like protein 2 [Elsinoe fawcettii]
MAPVKVSWDRLIRYVSATDNAIHYGEPLVAAADVEKIPQLANEGKLEVKVLDGSEPITLQPTGKTDKVKTLLGPIEPLNTPIMRCIGLNYKSHILEASRTLPPYPTTFTKPSHSAADHGEDIPIPRFASHKLDYEGELAFIIGRDCKDVRAADAQDVVGGYTATNDVSARDWQRDPELAGKVPQWVYGKSFDKFAPLGPVLVAPHVLGAADNLGIKTWLNGELRQQGNTADLCFGIPQIVEFLSRGTTLRKGTVIMTGTPGGVGLFMNPPGFIKDGDTVEVWVEGVGTLKNKYVVVGDE